MSDIEKLEADFEYWQECFKRCDDLTGQMMIAGKIKKIQREYHKIKDENNDR